MMHPPNQPSQDPTGQYPQPPQYQPPYPNHITQPPKSTFPKWLGFGCGGIAVILVSLFVLGLTLRAVGVVPPQELTSTAQTFNQVVASNATATVKALPTNTPLPTTQPPTATPAPTPTLAPSPTPVAIVPTTGFGVIRAGANILDNPSPNAKVIEQITNNGVVAWQNSTSDNKYYERLGGGWVSYSDLTNFTSQGAALTAIAPTPIPTPIPPTAKPAQVAGIGVTRTVLVEKFTNLGFTFSEGALSKGQPNILGRHSKGNLLQLIGTENNLINCSITLIISNADKSTQATSINHIENFIAIVLPGSDARQWFLDNLTNSLKQSITTTYGNKTVTLQSLGATDGALVTFSVESNK